jgi:hypothetical protein
MNVKRGIVQTSCSYVRVEADVNETEGRVVNRWTSASTIISTSCLKLTFGSQPSTALAFAGLPIR